MLQSKIINDNDKLRLVLIALITLQLPMQEINALIEKLSYEDQRIVTKLKAFGYDPALFANVKRVTKNVDPKTRYLK